MSNKEVTTVVKGNGRSHRKERGASTVEWAGLTVVGVILLLAVAGIMNAASGGQIGQAVLDGFENMIQAIQGGGVSVASSEAPDGSSPSADAPAISLPSIGVSQAVTSAVNPDDGGEDSGGGGFWGQVGGFFVGIFEGGRDTVVGIVTLLWDGVRGLPVTGDIYGLFDPEGREEVRAKYGALWDAIVDDPLGTGGDMLYAMVEPIVTDWQEGRYGEAVGRSLFEIALFFVPGDEVGKAGTLGRIDQMLPDEIFAMLARADRLTPDELAALLARIDQMTPDEMADFLRRLDQMTPEELVHNACNYQLIYERLNKMTPDEFDDMLVRLDELTPEELRALANYKSRWESFFERKPYVDEFGRYNLHHGYPQEFRDFFYERGIDIDNPHNMFELPESLHTRLPDGIHTGPYPESWNGRWDEWIKNHPQATPEEIIRFRDQLMREFNIEDYLGQATPIAPPGIPPRIDD